MRRRFPLTLSPLVALSLLVVLSGIAFAVTLGGDATADPPAAALADLASTSELTGQAGLQGCTSTPPVRVCTFQGQCCRCPCSFIGTCGSIGGQLICVCPCAQ